MATVCTKFSVYVWELMIWSLVIRDWWLVIRDWGGR